MARRALGDGRARPLQFVTTHTGCFVCISHLPNQDGYFRKGWSGVVEMFHRFIYRAHKGPIPEGHEVDHECGNRACCNPKHLNALSRLEHLVKTNKARYASRRAQAKAYWQAHARTGTELAARFGVNFGSACGWVREWKRQ